MTARFRWRTRLRQLLPFRPPLYRVVPKGRDCGDHNWYLSEGTVWHCYHCQAVQEPG